jgi:hypothetical protein
MTKTQIWTSVFLGVFILLFFLQQLTKQEETKMPPAMKENYPEETVTQELSGMQLVNSFGCITCHGGDLAGSKMAPTLYGLNQNYSRDKLINYLRNPNSFMDSDRFKEFKEKYRNVIMPSYNNRDVKDLGKIADYLLTLQ